MPLGGSDDRRPVEAMGAANPLNVGDRVRLRRRLGGVVAEHFFTFVVPVATVWLLFFFGPHGGIGLAERGAITVALSIVLPILFAVKSRS